MKRTTLQVISSVLIISFQIIISSCVGTLVKHNVDDVQKRIDEIECSEEISDKVPKKKNIIAFTPDGLLSKTIADKAFRSLIESGLFTDCMKKRGYQQIGKP